MMSEPQIERRSLVLDEVESDEPLLRIESRSENGEAGTDWIVGYAARFGVDSLTIDGEFTERIDPGAFSIVSERRGRRRKLETRALYNHNADMPLARYPKTLHLTVDDVGLRYEFPVPDTSYGRDVASNIRAGIIKGSSFSFTVPAGGDEWTMEEGRSIRTIRAIDSLIDVGPVTFPAYPDADVSVARRSFDAFRAGHEARVSKARATREAVRQTVDLYRGFLRQHGG